MKWIRWAVLLIIATAAFRQLFINGLWDTSDEVIIENILLSVFSCAIIIFAPPEWYRSNYNIYSPRLRYILLFIIALPLIILISAFSPVFGLPEFVYIAIYVLIIILNWLVLGFFGYNLFSVSFFGAFPEIRKSIDSRLLLPTCGWRGCRTKGDGWSKTYTNDLHRCASGRCSS